MTRIRNSEVSHDEHKYWNTKMNPAERALMSYFKKIKPRKIGFIELHTDCYNCSIDIDLDARYDVFAPECIFDDCSKRQSKLFLEAFLRNRISAGWNISTQLSKLLSRRGNLVKDIIEPIIEDTNWKSFTSNALFLSYLSTIPDGAKRAEKLLDIVPEDFRDGLFIACLRMNSRRLDNKLMTKFREWSHDISWGNGSGELGALHACIKQWLSRWPASKYSDLMKVYFERT